ncbi:hypothetical protein BO83DRAFT_342820 [Aspergillus eucalypticola CBS 122712]|uniref:Zn(2)-C6 fungal-type domain-containing protein n=1 Tax=Aspergillus eucalypticola (strain CBS 122712 / IBT 29274) TaxID=1448314 RepID=A0A317V183_ASPEC|nr:uncharacterized protein BO83DRAFT_342820 [Aspergillus eucalypticola CBS 122712]PWY67815.1 hypothetical protein BO83DRAFT_342820 [Aspergillus eucalypticola CBS 122712]
MTRSTGARLYRACLRCRQRKTKCDLKYTGGGTHTPCSKCNLEGHQCLPATSRRGGDYSQFRGRRWGNTEMQAPRSSEQIETKTELQPNTLEAETVGVDTDTLFRGGVRNPLEALQILARTAATAGEDDSIPLPEKAPQGSDDSGHEVVKRVRHKPGDQPKASIMATEIVKEGVIDVVDLEPLVHYYTMNYHPYFPIVSSSLLYTEVPEHQWATETFLLTSILTIATQNRPDQKHLHTRIRGYIDKLILRVTLGARSVRNVGTVEGLLLLAEWMPHLMLSQVQPYSNNSEQSNAYDEDCVAWNLIGLAVRQAYLLHLDTQSFPFEVASEPLSMRCRRRLAWIFTYLADRQISIQMGQAFWSRGPSLSTRFSTQDYPSLQPEITGGTDYASFVQAQVELTTIFGNTHDILYASKSRTLQIMLVGDYPKYLDDSAKAMEMWKGTWSNVDIPPSLRCLLTLQYQYLQLYVNAFAFQAVLYRSSKSLTNMSHDDNAPLFPDGVMASADARHIYAAISAARDLLQTFVEEITPPDIVKFLPVRYYLYEIYASVFLFKAHSVGAIPPDESQTYFNLTRQFISMLKAAATSQTHISHRYAKLLGHLWCHGKVTPELRQGSAIQEDEYTTLQEYAAGAPANSDGFLQPVNVDTDLMDVFSGSLPLDLGRSWDSDFYDETLFSSLPFFRGFRDLEGDYVA